MQKSSSWRGGAAVLLVLIWIGTAWGAEATPPLAPTRITVEGMHCPTCAKKITGRLKTVAGVVDAQADVKAGIITVLPKDGSTPSPKALWEAVEQAKFKPVRLDCPNGSFRSKPKS